MSFPQGRALVERAERVIPGGVNSATRKVGAPYGFSRSKGAYVWDADGNRYVDFHAAFGAIVLGHNDPQVDAAVADAAKHLDLVGLGVTELEVELAEQVSAAWPSIDQMIACTSGSDATSNAIRVARSATGRRLIVKVQGGFHGWHDPFARNVISRPDLAYGFDPNSAGVLRENYDATLIAEYNDIASLERLYAEHPGEIAAVIVEPVPHNVGALMPADGYLEDLRRVTAAGGTVLIFDEVITGFRHALGGWQSLCGVTPDLTTFGKSMANGYPIAGLGGSRELMSQFGPAGGPVMLAGTFTGHPAMSAGALETIRQLRDTDVLPRAHRLGRRMRDGLKQVVDELGIPGVVSGYGSIFCLYFLDGEVHGYRDLMRDDDAKYIAYHRGMTERGFLMLPMALKRNHISGAHTDADIDLALEASRDVLKQVAALSAAAVA